MKILYLDCFSGVSGDMVVGALTDLGVQPSTFEWELSKVDLGDFHMHFERKMRGGISGIKFGIHEGATHTHDQDEEENGPHHHHEHGPECDHGHVHDHEEEEHEKKAVSDEKYGHSHEGHEHEHGPDCHHDHEEDHEEHSHSHEEHHHEHGPECGHHHGEHEHEEHAHAGRNHREIRALILASGLSDFVKEKSLAIFQRIAVAEGKIHGMAPEEVTFHEVGALDSIADIICACVGIETLGVGQVLVSKLFDGTGWIDCAHGRFPLPAPATLEILAGLPFSQIDEPFEFVTPTGAAIVAEFAAGFGPMPALKVEKIGYGVGSRQSKDRPNVLRVILAEPDAKF